MWKSNEFSIWQGMIQRCHDANMKQFARYGARGITVCEEWRNDFAAFYAAVGPRPSKAHSLERIKNNRGYEPGNVRWATATEQANNRRDNLRAEVDGVSLTAAQIARAHGFSESTVRRRIKAGLVGQSLVAACRAATRRYA
jgi:hypothetical protein